MSVGCSKAIGIQNTRLLCKSCHPTWHTFAIQQDKAFNQFMLQKDRDEEDKTNDRELVHGFTGAPHIDVNDIASFNTGIAGPGDYMLNTKGLLKASMSNANTFVLASGNLLMQGRHVTFVFSISATVVSGAQGAKRNDLAVCPYSRASNGVETAELMILQETAMQGTPADPRISEGLHDRRRNRLGYAPVLHPDLRHHSRRAHPSLQPHTQHVGFHNPHGLDAGGT